MSYHEKEKPGPSDSVSFRLVPWRLSVPPSAWLGIFDFAAEAATWVGIGWLAGTMVLWIIRW